MLSVSLVRPPMPIQLPLNHELLPATLSLALIPSRPGVIPHMHRQMSSLREALSALLARERPAPAVQHEMALQVRRRAERLSTRPALERPDGRGVSLEVRVQVAAVRERLSAQRACVPLGGRVRAFVLVEVRLRHEGLVASCASERADALVEQQVGGKVNCFGEGVFSFC